jgi:hypothetical protein
LGDHGATGFLLEANYGIYSLAALSSQPNAIVHADESGVKQVPAISLDEFCFERRIVRMELS